MIASGQVIYFVYRRIVKTAIALSANLLNTHNLNYILTQLLTGQKGGRHLFKMQSALQIFLQGRRRGIDQKPSMRRRWRDPLVELVRDARAADDRAGHRQPKEEPASAAEKPALRRNQAQDENHEADEQHRDQCHAPIYTAPWKRKRAQCGKKRTLTCGRRRPGRRALRAKSPTVWPGQSAGKEE
jgi:hypothetical protein